MPKFQVELNEDEVALIQALLQQGGEDAAEAGETNYATEIMALSKRFLDLSELKPVEETEDGESDLHPSAEEDDDDEDPEDDDEDPKDE